MRPTPCIQWLLGLLLGVSPLIGLGQPTGTNQWLDFYDTDTLQQTAQLTPPGIRTNWLEVIWPRLNPDEKKALKGVQLEFPLQDSAHPMNFYSSHPPFRMVKMPLSSLRFLRDICLASAYLNRKEYDEKPLSDYLSILKYQWPGLKSQTCPYRPLEALHVPADAMQDTDVQSLWQKLFNTSVVFILCHELGHIRYGHRGYAGISDQQAQQHETQADAFALDLMKRIGDPPFGGIVLTFFVYTHLNIHPNDKRLAHQPATHPLGSVRIKALARHMNTNRDTYSRQQPDFARAVKSIEDLATMLENEALLETMDQIGYSGDICRLGLRRVGQAGPVAMPSNKQPFTGTFTGNWVDDHKQRMPITLSLYQNKTEVSGNGFLDKGMPILVKDGFVTGDKLSFSWQMGKEYFGQGELKLTKGGLLGWWGTRHRKTIKKSGDLVLIRTY
jgi:hypothetical protein